MMQTMPMMRMMRMMRTFPAVLAGIGVLLLASCASAPDDSSRLYDLGALPAHAAPPAGLPPLPAISVAEAKTPAWLDSQRMFYRLDYADGRQPRSYANSLWTMSPGQLFVQRLASRLAQEGGVVAPASAGALNLPTLYLETDDFSQIFDGPSHSYGLVEIRASLFDGRVLRAQKTFVQRVPAATPDARGGAAALAQASDAAIDGIATWLANLPARK